MGDTSIEWTDKTWNPVTGCGQISPGCANCYAKRGWDMRHKAFLAGKPMAVQYADPFEVVKTQPQRLSEPLSWRGHQRVFVNSVSDLFHEDVPDEFILRVFEVMERAKQHTFQVLTKRPQRMLDVLGGSSGAGLEAPPLSNVWLGVSVENQHFADERIPLLLQAPAAVRFISAEPLLGPVDLDAVVHTLADSSFKVGSVLHGDDGFGLNAPRQRLDWVIVGGESGPGARPFDLAWARSIVQQCQAAGVPVFVKQLGAKPIVSRDIDALALRGRQRLRNGNWLSKLESRKGGDPSEWPEDLRVREFPGVSA